MKTVIATARVEPWVKELIKNKGMTIRDALEYIAMVLASKVELTKVEIRKTENEISELNLEYDRRSHEMDMILSQIQDKEEYLQSLKDQLDESIDPNTNIIETVKPAIESVFTIAHRFNCHPCDVNKYTNRDTLAFQAKKFNISKPLLKELLVIAWEGEEGQ